MDAEEPTSQNVVLGFPNAALDAHATALNLNDLVVTNPTATFFMRIESDAWANAGVGNGDVVVIDRSRTPKDSDLIVAAMDGDFTIVQYNEVTSEIMFWGVITWVIRRQL